MAEIKRIVYLRVPVTIYALTEKDLCLAVRLAKLRLGVDFVSGSFSAKSGKPTEKPAASREKGARG